jgi:hypothetical protein
VSALCAALSAVAPVGFAAAVAAAADTDAGGGAAPGLPRAEVRTAATPAGTPGAAARAATAPVNAAAVAGAPASAAAAVSGERGTTGARASARSKPAAATSPAPMFDATPVYRTGLPPVMGRDAARAPAIPPDFAAWYARHERPRVMLFWNRILDAAAGREQASQSLGVATTVRPDGTTATALAWQQGAPPPVPMRTLTLRERADWPVEAGFLQLLRKAGVRTIDPAVAVRLQSIDAADDADRRALEMQALAKHADALCEVWVTPDAAGALGAGFRVSCRDLRSGEHLANLYVAGLDSGDDPHGRDAPSVSGWRRAEAAPRTPLPPKRVGEQLASRVLAALVAGDASSVDETDEAGAGSAAAAAASSTR